MRIIGHKSDRMHRRYNNVNEADLLKAAARINTVITPANSAIPAKVISH